MANVENVIFSTQLKDKNMKKIEREVLETIPMAAGCCADKCPTSGSGGGIGG